MVNASIKVPYTCRVSSLIGYRRSNSDAVRNVWHAFENCIGLL